jgi:hypothetical protein
MAMATPRTSRRRPSADPNTPPLAPRLEPFEARESFSLDELAVRHGVAWEFIWQQIQEGKLEAGKLGGDGPWRVTRHAERRWIETYAPREVA